MNADFKPMLKSSKRLVGSFLQLPSLEVAEIFSNAGFDFLIIDNEHSVMDVSFSQNMMRAITAAGGIPLIRPPDCEETTIKKTMDIGVPGIVLPGISGEAMLQEAMRHTKYAPAGTRGACPCVRANKYGEGDNSYYARANRDTAVLIQVEGAGAYEEIDGILAVEGLDGILMGPVDLSMSLGVPGEISHPIVEKVLLGILEKAKKQRVATGIFCMETGAVEKWFSLGIDFVLYGIDSMFIRETAYRTVQTLRRFA